MYSKVKVVNQSSDAKHIKIDVKILIMSVMKETISCSCDTEVIA